MFIRLTLTTAAADGWPKSVIINSDQIVTIREREGATQIDLSTGDADRVVETLADVATALGLPAVPVKQP